MVNLQAARVIVHRQAMKARAVTYKGGKCERCGYDKCQAAMDFHHRDPSRKDFSISSGRTMSWERAVRELDKCILLCSNCHREEHDIIRSKRRVELETAVTESRRRPNVELRCHCGNTVIVNASRVGKAVACSLKCSARHLERANWPDDPTLARLVWSSPVTKIAEDLGVSPQSVAKRCKSREIPVPGPGYWSRVKP
jgi:hypothetical protein